MNVLGIILKGLFVADCIGLIFVILIQEGKSAGLGTISGMADQMADAYWGKNKGRSVEGRLLVLTRVMCALFLILAAVLNMSIFS